LQWYFVFVRGIQKGLCLCLCNCTWVWVRTISHMHCLSQVSCNCTWGIKFCYPIHICSK
jgi:hypothetical protein